MIRIRVKAGRAEEGSVAQLLTTGLLVLAMTVLMASYLESVQLLSRKEEVNQLARKYILRMETTGYLSAEDRAGLERELAGVGVTELELGGTTLSGAGYGNEITLSIRGRLPGKSAVTKEGVTGTFFEGRAYPFREQRSSTAKN